jgi:hypothetical protein
VHPVAGKLLPLGHELPQIHYPALARFTLVVFNAKKNEKQFVIKTRNQNEN